LLRRGLETEPAQGLELDNIKTHRWHIVQCSAITGDHLLEGIEWVVQDAKDRLFLF
jgi:ADP-ribosylation factor-like protein 2